MKARNRRRSKTTAHRDEILVACSKTIRLMSEIDGVIDKHGSWPSAFAAKVASKEP
jgi:hypothetical protein